MCSNQLSYSGFFENPGLPLFSECKYIAFFYSCKICPTFFHKTSYLYGKIIVLRNVPKNPPTDFRPDYEHIAESGSIRTGIRPAHMGFRHHPRNRRPGYASFRLPQRRGTPRSNPPSHYDLRLHHSPIYAQTDSPGRGDRNHGLRPTAASPPNCALRVPSSVARRPSKSSTPSTAATDCDSKTISTLSPIFITGELRSLPSDMPTFRTNP